VKDTLKRSEVLTVVSARLLHKLLPVVIFGVLLEVCLIIYAMAWFLGAR